MVMGMVLTGVVVVVVMMRWVMVMIGRLPGNGNLEFTRVGPQVNVVVVLPLVVVVVVVFVIVVIVIVVVVARGRDGSGSWGSFSALPVVAPAGTPGARRLSRGGVSGRGSPAAGGGGGVTGRRRGWAGVKRRGQRGRRPP